MVIQRRPESKDFRIEIRLVTLDFFTLPLIALRLTA